MENLKKKLRFQLLKYITILFTKIPKFIIQIIKFYLFLHLPRLYKKETLALFLHKYSKKKRKNNENQNSNYEKESQIIPLPPFLNTIQN